MGHIKEPKGIDLVVLSVPYTESDREFISSIIADFKKTGRKPLSIKVGRQVRIRKNLGMPVLKPRKKRAVQIGEKAPDKQKRAPAFLDFIEKRNNLPVVEKIITPTRGESNN